MKILLAVDGSPPSDIAIREIAERTWPPGSIVRALHVLRPPMVAGAYAPPPALAAGAAWPSAMIELEKMMGERASELLAEIASRLSRPGLLVETKQRDGDPRTEIVDDAEEWSADLVVLGSHGYTGLRRLLLGSVALSVVSHAPCSVEVVRARRSKS